MKKTLLLSLLGIALSSFTLFGENILDFHHLFGRCSGSNAYCSACSNCSACKNCAENGGSCAVCYTPKAVRKPARKSTPKSSSTGFSYRSPVVYRRAGSAQPIKSSPDNHIQPSRISTSQTTSDLAERPVSSPIVSEESVDLVSEEQASLSDTITNFDYKVDIPLDAEFVRVNAPVANLRTSATTKSQVKQKVKYGELLIKLGASGDWVKVQTLDSGFIGYVFADLVQ